MLNSQGSTIIAPDQTLTTQTSPAIQFSQYADVLKSFAQVDDTSASALISQLQTMQGALSDETVIADIAMANNLDPKQLQLAVRMISAKDAATHLSSTSVDAQSNVIASPSNIPGAAELAQQSLQVNPAETVAQLAGQVPLTPSPSAPQQFQTPEQTIQSLQQQFDAVVQALKAKGVNAQYTLGSIAPTYQETPEQRAQRIEKELAVYQKRLEKWELLNPVNAVTITKAKRGARRIRKSYAQANYGKTLQKAFGWPLLSRRQSLDPSAVAGKMSQFEQTHGPATRASLPVRAKAAREQKYNQVKQAFNAVMANAQSM